jgi:hypothetical protein
VEAAVSRISALAAWRRGGGAGALASLGLLASGWLGTVGPLAGVGTGVCIVVGAEIALRRFLRKCTLRPELAEIPAVARCRDRLCSVRRRRQLARSVRSTAVTSPGAQASPLVLWDRVALVRDELLALADELESADTVDPRTMVEIHDLLCSGRDSPMLNDQLPTSALVSAVLCARFRLVTAPLRRTTHTSAAASLETVAAPDDEDRSANARPSARGSDASAPGENCEADDR